jgi:hypothetical protein
MRATWHHVVLILVLVSVLYAPAIRNDFLFNDQTVLQSLPADGGADQYLAAMGAPAADGSWHPLVCATLIAQKQVSGETALPFRLFNIVLLGLAGVAFYFFLRLSAFGSRRIPAFLAALILVAHPVASVGIYHLCEGREILLGLLFILLSTAFYLRGGWLGALAAAGAYALALGSTEQALWLPAVLAVAEAVGLAGWKGLESDTGKSAVNFLKVVPQKKPHAAWLRLLPVLVVNALFLIWRWKALGSLVPVASVPPRAPFYEWLYGWEVLAMPRRALVYQPGVSQWFSALWIFPALLLMAVVLGVVVTALLHPSITPPERRKDEQRRVLVWGTLLLCLFPALTGLLDGKVPFDEGRQLFFILPILGVMAWGASRFWTMEICRREIVVVSVAVVVVLSAVSMGRRDYYANDETFSSHWVRTAPEAWKTLALRAESWVGAGRLGPAEREVERGLMLKPDEPGLLVVREAIQEKTGRWEEALRTLESLSTAEPTNLAFRVKTADVIYKMGRFREARDLYAGLVEALPGDAALKEKLEAARKAVPTAPES